MTPHREARHAQLVAREQLVLVPGGGDGEQGLAEDVGRHQAVEVHEDLVRLLLRLRLRLRVRVRVRVRVRARGARGPWSAACATRCRG